MTSNTPMCAACGRRPRRKGGHRLCSDCHRARYDPPTGNPGGAGITKTREAIEARLEDLQFLQTHETNRVTIAARLGISTRTLFRYRQRLKT